MNNEQNNFALLLELIAELAKQSGYGLNFDAHAFAAKLEDAAKELRK